MRKLPIETATAWEELLGADSNLPFSQFIQFLENKYRTLEMLEPIDSNNKKTTKIFHTNKTTDSQPKFSKKQKAKSSNNNNVQSISKSNSKSFSKHKQSCVMCKGDHYLGKCDRFTKLSRDERFHFLKNNRCCINCLSSSHLISNCASQKYCRVCEGKKKHHTSTKILTPKILQAHPILFKQMMIFLNDKQQKFSILIPHNNNTELYSEQLK